MKHPMTNMIVFPIFTAVTVLRTQRLVDFTSWVAQGLHGCCRNIPIALKIPRSDTGLCPIRGPCHPYPQGLRFAYRQVFSIVLFRTLKRALQGRPFAGDNPDRTAAVNYVPAEHRDSVKV